MSRESREQGFLAAWGFLFGSLGLTCWLVLYKRALLSLDFYGFQLDLSYLLYVLGRANLLVGCVAAIGGLVLPLVGFALCVKALVHGVSGGHRQLAFAGITLSCLSFIFDAILFIALVLGSLGA